MKRIATVLCLLGMFGSGRAQEIYELREYQIRIPWQAGPLHQYFENALIPALERHGIKRVAVFEEMEAEWPPSIYFFVAYDNMGQYMETIRLLKSDQAFHNDASAYYSTPESSFPFTDFSTSLYTAFAGMPEMKVPATGREIFELRTYEAYQEDALRRKVKMFNDSELKIFDEVGLPPVFFGEKIAGSDMPCLTYMLSFESMEEHKENWDKFGRHPEWVRIRDLEEYENTVSDFRRVFLKRTAYSRF